MPNRIIKEAICTSDDINELTAEQEVFFYRLMVNCDDYGRFDARTDILRSRLYPLKMDKVKPKDIESWLSVLINKKMVMVYLFGGKKYLQMINWSKHQQMRAKKSKFPAPDSNGNQVISDDSNSPRESEYENPIRESEYEYEPEKPADIPQPKQTKKSKNKKSSDREGTEPYTTLVWLKPSEYGTLCDKYTETGAKYCIDELEAYKRRSGNEYVDDYGAINGWVKDKYLKENKSSPGRSQVGAMDAIQEALRRCNSAN